MDTSAESIQELIETLDQRKDEAIERTFKQVSKYFEEVFEKLVPSGRGQLIMQTKADGFVVSLPLFCTQHKADRIGGRNGGNRSPEVKD